LDEKAREKILQTPCDFLVVVAFGQILPLNVLQHPRVAPLNIHASLLPAYRGAAPIQRALMEGEEKTGVSIQWMIEALDQGDVLLQKHLPIEETDTSEILHSKLSQLGAEALLECLDLFENDQIVRRSQDARVGSYAPKLTKRESSLSFDQPAFFVHRSIMGLNPWPTAECFLSGKKLKIWTSTMVPRDAHAEPGTVVDTSDGMIVVACQQGCVGLLEVQIENKKRMSAKEFLQGHPIRQGLILGKPNED
jgi:methionyl-tRNA formyltransferase